MDEHEYNLPDHKNWLFERRCPECGRVFCITLVEAWIYKSGDSFLCSWGCVRRREERKRQSETEAAARRNAKLSPGAKMLLIRRYVFRGFSNAEITKATGFSDQLIRYYRKKIEDGVPDGDD